MPGPIGVGEVSLVERDAELAVLVIEFDDGTILREESDALAARIQGGKLRQASQADLAGA